MKKFIILIIILFALLSIDHPLLNKYRAQLLGDSVSYLSDAAKVNRSPVATLTKNLITKEIRLSDSEREYINKTFTSDESVRLFHLRYCKQHDLNLYFYEERLDQVCNTINVALDMKRSN
ncbi:hypothetical protein J8L70_12960 [Pseudoalteromonas sp. MMG010]|uniref:hypothetical protein n=1 Tax=Pseudoalteromonas sp. MMG010 TaxID=2822685 RepID=UPI001B3A0FC1|nr:hypothetical protein [Pseudoalteromonas sp. MMG010]MBQ4834157.1 hypothetical protein [Pseudoalteromonas sp. MMG010]